MKTLKQIGLLLFAGLLLVIGLTVYDTWDTDGYVPHKLTVEVWMPHQWLVGETVECAVNHDPDVNGRVTEQIAAVVCGLDLTQLDQHTVDVTFWGRLKPVDMDGHPVRLATGWKCKRGEEDFTCKAVR